MRPREVLRSDLFRGSKLRVDQIRPNSIKYSMLFDW